MKDSEYKIAFQSSLPFQKLSQNIEIDNLYIYVIKSSFKAITFYNILINIYYQSANDPDSIAKTIMSTYLNSWRYRLIKSNLILVA